MFYDNHNWTILLWKLESIVQECLDWSILQYFLFVELAYDVYFYRYLEVKES